MPSVMPRIYKALTPRLKKLGFRKKGSHYFILAENFAFCIRAEYPGAGVHSRFCILPLFMPADSVHLTYGNRLNNMYPKDKLRWLNGYSTDQDIEAWAGEVAEALQSEILPFFDSVSTPEKMLRFLEGGLNARIRYFFCPPDRILWLRAYIHLCLKDRDAVRELLDEYRKYILSESVYTEKVKQSCLEEAEQVKQRLSGSDADIDRFLLETRVQVLNNCFGM